MIQVAIVDRERIPRRRWKDDLRARIAQLTNNKAIMVILPRGDSPRSITDAWYKLARELHHSARTSIHDSEAGRSVFLWFE